MNEKDRRDIVDQVVQQFAADKIQDHEVVLRDDGLIVIDRRQDLPWATPTVVGEWSLQHVAS